jgi:biotin transport system substrate-specific component
MAMVSYITMPNVTGVPFSLQPFIAMLAGAILGSKRGAISMIVYTVMGVVGLPVFAGGTGGLGKITSPTFGYILGFILCAYAVGLVIELFGKNPKTRVIGYVLAPFIGLAIDYIVGVPYLFMIFNTVMGKSISFYVALTYGFFPYILLDLIKAGIVVFLAMTLLPRLEKAGVLD